MHTEETLPEIRQSIVLNVPIEKAWKAVSTSEGIAAWWMPNTFEAVVGHEFTLHAGQYGDSPCKVTDIEPPYRVGFDWDKDWHLVFELKELGADKTEFTVIHSGWDASKETKFGQPHSAIRGFMESGWAKLKDKLAEYVEA